LPDDLPLVPFDSILLQQVLVNLLENAAKYAPEDTEITVSAKLAAKPDVQSELEMVVADRGPGFAKGDEEKIFAKFYRAEKGRGGGVGLGLTICKGIVTAHGGRIWAAPREGGGAELHFTLPIEGNPPTLVEVASA
jgi:two-component system sensor histidine kinase KdpD